MNKIDKIQDREKLQRQIKSAKASILVVAVFTIINTILIVTNADVIFTFSPHVPQIITSVFVELAADEGARDYIWLGVAFGVFAGLVYAGCWLGSRKYNAFITVTLVLFAVDSAVLIFDVFSYFDASVLIDLGFHALVLYDLTVGVLACKKLKKLPAAEGIDRETFDGEIDGDVYDYSNYSAENDAANEYQNVSSYDAGTLYDSNPIGYPVEKSRLIMSADYRGMTVEVRRSRGLTELIVDGMVYAQRKGIVESEYTLTAKVSGVIFSTTMTEYSVMYLYADGQMIKKKTRLI